MLHSQAAQACARALYTGMTSRASVEQQPGRSADECAAGKRVKVNHGMSMEPTEQKKMAKQRRQ